jgi:CysZ protein
MTAFSAPARAIAQFDDPAFVGVVLRSVLWAVLALAGTAVAVSWGLEALVADHLHGALWGWLAALAGGAGVAVASLYLFLPLAALIATMFVGRVTAAVEHRFYPFLPPGRSAPLGDQIMDGIGLGLRVLVWQIVALVLGLVIPGIGLLLGWAVAAWALGRGLFVAVAMTRMDRAQAVTLYRTQRTSVWVQGALMAAASFVPVLNVLAPVLGVAALVHVLHATNPAVPLERRAGFQLGR